MLNMLKFRIMKHKIRTDARQILAGNHRISGTDLSLAEWVERESKNEPGFFRWLFDEPESTEFTIKCSGRITYTNENGCWSRKFIGKKFINY